MNFENSNVVASAFTDILIGKVKSAAFVVADAVMDGGKVYASYTVSGLWVDGRYDWRFAHGRQEKLTIENSMPIMGGWELSTIDEVAIICAAVRMFEILQKSATQHQAKIFRCTS